MPAFCLDKNPTAVSEVMTASYKALWNHLTLHLHRGDTQGIVILFFLFKASREWGQLDI